MTFFPTLRQLAVRSLNTDLRHIFWTVDSSAEDLLDYTIGVDRSESPEGPWERVSPDLRDRYHFVDQSIPVGQRYRSLYYRVIYTHLPTGESKSYGPATQEPEVDLISRELRQQIALVYREFSGRLSWLFPVRTFGPRCPDCWRPNLGSSVKSRCVTCYGTSFARGYLSPIEVWVTIDPSSNSRQPAATGTQEQNNTTARLGYYPTIKPGDVLIEPENRRWKVIVSNAVEHVRVPIRQELQLHEIPPRDIEMELPLPSVESALKDMSFSPPRNYTNPANVDEGRAFQLLYGRQPTGRRGPP